MANRLASRQGREVDRWRFESGRHDGLLITDPGAVTGKAVYLMGLLFGAPATGSPSISSSRPCPLSSQLHRAREKEPEEAPQAAQVPSLEADPAAGTRPRYRRVGILAELVDGDLWRCVRVLVADLRVAAPFPLLVPFTLRVEAWPLRWAGGA
jgi:hypothetical protein